MNFDGRSSIIRILATIRFTARPEIREKHRNESVRPGYDLQPREIYLAGAGERWDAGNEF